MKAVLLVFLAITLMAGNCMPIVAGTAALQGVPALVNPIASQVGNALGENIGQLIRNAFLPLFDTSSVTNGG